MGFFIGLFIGCGFETGPNDWHDCDLCDATSKVKSK